MNHTLLGILEIAIFLAIGVLGWRPMRRAAIRRMRQHDVSRE